MVTTKETSLPRKGQRKAKTGPQQRQISSKASSKWQLVTADLRKAVTLMLEDAASRFEESGSVEVEEMLRQIKESFQQALTTLRVPDKKWTSERNVKSSTAWLAAENSRLENLQASLEETLHTEKRNVEMLEAKIQQLRAASETSTSDESTEIHPILKNLEAGGSSSVSAQE